MAPGPPAVVTSSATPTGGKGLRIHQHRSSKDEDEPFKSNAGLVPPLRSVKEARSISNASMFGPRTASLANSIAPGSFSSNLKTTTPRTATRPDFNAYVSIGDGRADENMSSERKQADVREKIQKEQKIKTGSENLLGALMSKPTKQVKDQRQKVELEISASNRKIAELESQLHDLIEQSKRPVTPAHLQPVRGSPLRPSSRLSDPSAEAQEEEELEAESPTFVLAEILQALEVDGRPPDFYVLRANGLVDLFKRHVTLKYDLAWSDFGLRVQAMLLSESREVVAAGYRVARHAITDRKSLQTIRALQTDPLVVLSLAKDSKATIEREQALKFIRAFVDVKEGAQEISNAVVRAIVSVAEHHEDRLKNIAVLTLSEIMVKSPNLLVRAGGVAPLSDSLRDGTYPGPEGILAAFLYLYDDPKLRKLFFSGQEMLGPFSLFADPLCQHTHEERSKANARAVTAIITAWSGLFALAGDGFSSLSALLSSLQHPDSYIRNLVLDMLFDILHIKPPSWTSSFLAGRRLTTYGRVATLRVDAMEHSSRLENEDDLNRANLVDHHTALLLRVLVDCGLVDQLSDLTDDLNENEDPTIARKTTLLLSEVLKLIDHLLPASQNAQLQTLPNMMRDESLVHDDEEEADTYLSSTVSFQLDSVTRTLHRTGDLGKNSQKTSLSSTDGGKRLKGAELGKPRLNVDMDEIQFRSLLIETQVVSSANYLKWKWDLINDIIDGPLQNPKRLEDAKSTKFLKRLIGFYRPFKYRFADVRNTRPNQRYVRTACALIKALLKTPDGVQFLAESKLLRQLAECTAQLDRLSGITSSSPLFARDRVTETLTAGYFSMFGVLSSDPQGQLILVRWRMINMFYHIIELRDRDDVIQLLLNSMDFTIDGHLRVMLSKALTSCAKPIRIFSTKLLRSYATQDITSENPKVETSSVAHWAIRLLVTQLYDPDVEVSEVAVQILQEACNRKQYLEYVVSCRPALDHLGEIGAPLLLRFLSTSMGYEYLHGLDYITQEMDDWFLGRNEKYVSIVEGSLSRAYSSEPERPKSTTDEPLERQLLGIVPPHFYRELTRTREGCRLLDESGHFEEFVSTIKDFWAEEDDPETIIKVKGSLWAVGNVGSMELGAPFLERSNVVDWIIKIVERSGVLSIRGTAFFVLGLISKSLHGMEILAERGWDSATNQMGQSLGYVLPPSLATLFRVDLRQERKMLPPLALLSKAPPGISKDDPLESRVYSAVVESGNTVLSRRALNDLNSLKMRKPELFESAAVLRKILYILECHTIRLPVRQRIIDMFDKSVARKMILGESSDEEDEEADDDEDDDEEEEVEGEDEDEDNEDEDKVQSGKLHGTANGGVGDDEGDDDETDSQLHTARPALALIPPSVPKT